jgi:hypothetical protein
MTPEEAGVYGVSRVVRSTAGGPPVGLRKRSKAKHPRPSSAAMVSQEDQSSRLAEMAGQRPLGTEETDPRKKKFRRKNETRRMR